MKRTKEIWRGMWKRCGGLNGDLKGGALYKGKISVCDEWRSFENFISDMGEAPEGYTLDRIENSGNYCKSNCRWATHKTQTRNRTITRKVEFQGKEWFIKDLADHLGIRYDTLWRRLKSGWSPEDLTKKPHRGNQTSESKEKRLKRFLIYQNKKYALSDLAKQLEICPETLWSRNLRGWPEDRWGSK